jgi:hypothetical protein
MVLKPYRRSVKDIERTFKRRASNRAKFLKFKRLSREGDDEIEFWKNKKSIIPSGKVNGGY